MKTKLKRARRGSVAVLGITGPLTLGEGTGALRAKVQELAREGHKRIVMNLSSVKAIDSAGLGELIAAHSKFTAIGGNVKLSNVNRHVDDLLSVTRLYKVFQAFEDESEAVRSFSPRKKAA
jgi:anti-anti-sigma factor